MNGSGNGKDPDDKKIVKFPSLAERDRIKRAEREKEKRWRAEYKKQSQANRGEPFFNFGNVPSFTKNFIAAMVAVHVILNLLVSDEIKFKLITVFGFIPAQYTNMDSWGWQWGTLVSPLSHVLIHGSWMHLFFNLVMGLVLCMYFEKMFGTRSTVKFIIACTLAGALTFFVFHPFSNTPVVGASGAISGLFGALIYLTIGQNKNHPMTQRFGKYAPWPILIFWGLFIIVPGVLMGGASMAWEAHLGGYICGIGILVANQRGLIRFL